MPSDWKEDALRHKYDPLPDEPRHRKKAKKRHVRSDHRHDYEKVAVDAHSCVLSNGEREPLVYVMDRCKVCGRTGGRSWSRLKSDIPDDMHVYDVGGIMGLFAKELGEELRVR